MTVVGTELPLNGGFYLNSQNVIVTFERNSISGNQYQLLATG